MLGLVGVYYYYTTDTSSPPTPTMMMTSEPEAKESVVLDDVGVGGGDVMNGWYM